MAFLLPLSVLGYALLLFLPWRRNPELCLWAAVSGLMGALYLAGLAGALKPAAHGLFWLGLALSGWLGWLGPRRHIGFWGDFLTPGAVLFLLFSLLFHLVLPDAALQLWDEFSHWAVATKELLATHALPGPGGAIMFKEYPVGVNLLHYWAAVNSTDSEGVYYLAHFMLLSSPLAVLLSRLSWRSPGWVVFSWLASLLIIFTLSVFVCSLMVDVALGLYLGAALFAVAHMDVRSRATVLLAPALMALPLIKSTGYMFAWMALVGLGVKALGGLVLGRTQVPEQGVLGGLEEPRSAQGGWAAALALLLVLAAPLAAHHSWGWRVKALDLQPAFKTERITWDSATQALSSQASEKHKTVRANFAQALIDWPLSNYASEPERSLVRALGGMLGWPELSPPKLGPLAWGLVCALLFAAAYVRHRRRRIRRQITLVAWLLLLFGAFYIVGLLLLYMFSFSEYEAPRLASFGRYMNTLLMPAMLLGLAFALPDDLAGEEMERLGGGRAWAWSLLVGAALMAVLLQAPSWSGAPKWLARGDAAEERDFLSPMLEQVRRLVPLDQRVFIVYQASPGRGFHIARYELAPRPANKWFFSLGQPRFKDDVWTEPLSARQWSEMLVKENFAYVYVQRVDQGFVERYGPLFANPLDAWDHLVFRVVRPQSEGGLARLEALGQAKPRGKQWWGPGKWE